jgi:outer membrane protein OmpA-like peptidoglycan-associated protein
LRKILIGGLVLSGLLFGNSCTPSEKKRAEEILNQSFNESNFAKKVTLITNAKKICEKIANVELQYLKIKKSFEKSNLENMQKRLQNLNNLNDNLDSIHYKYKNRMKYQINSLFTKYYSTIGMETESEPIDNEVYKSLVRRRGIYQSHITFYKASARIKNRREAKKIKEAIRAILRQNPKARFSITGHSSSGGNHRYNKRLSQRRADSLERFIGKQSSIKTFSKGESQLICRDRRLPYRDNQGEYHCRGGENKNKSRRVIIKRID